ncbi:hypothetical protein BDB00DRAFT_819824 [Zychaea mexicana]|uniref:uncharacterized protein n=1 Tax=Zychaea mexicana TaxID=64656 RepID=UPI0022FE4B5A|nr:uncharacterized protein BDB00DRAFT_819824 [Zychaea mexicana]KAI9494147.1 hypothetical protein BDB00DRAFT_819824 [Zychaea mexicana]
MASGDPLFEDDAFAASQSLEQELLGKGYNITSLGPSLAAEIHSATTTPETATTPERLPPNAVGGGGLGIGSQGGGIRDSHNEHDLHELLVGAAALSNNNNHHHLDDCTTTATSSNPASPTGIASPSMPWSPTTWMRSRRSSYSSSTWSTTDNIINDVDEIDPFEYLKRQLEELNSAIWETKTLHKRMFNTVLADPNMQKAPPLELAITSVISLVERKSKDRERQTSSLRNIDSSIRKEGMWMTLDVIRELDLLVQTMKMTLYDPNYAYENPLPTLHQLHAETSSMTQSLEELKEIMYVNKRQVQELNSRLRSIAKTVHEVRKDIRRINKFLEDKDDEEEVVVLEKGEVGERVKEIMWGLDDLDRKSTTQLKEMQLFWEQLC